jgi:hypothetical protein
MTNVVDPGRVKKLIYLILLTYLSLSLSLSLTHTNALSLSISLSSTLFLIQTLKKYLTTMLCMSEMSEIDGEIFGGIMDGNSAAAK